MPPLENVLPISKGVVGRQLNEKLMEGGDQGTRLVAPEPVPACWNQYDAVVRRIRLEAVGVQRAEVLDVVGYDGTPVARRCRQHPLIGNARQFGLRRRYDIVAPDPQLLRDRRRKLLIEEQPHARLIAC